MGQGLRDRWNGGGVSRGPLSTQSLRGSAPSSPVSLSFFLLRRSGPQLVEGNFALFCTYTLGFRNEFQNLLLAIMVRVGPRGWLKVLRL